MKDYNTSCVGLVLLALIFLVGWPTALCASWYIDSSIAAKYLGGPSRMGPFATRAQAEAVIAANPSYGLRLIPGGYDEGSGGRYVTGSPSSNDAAERQRQQEEAAERLKRQEEEKRLEAEEAQRKQEEFEEAKREALSSMKGITENELGLKGISTNDDLGLKGIGDRKTDDLGLKGVGDSPPPAFVDSSMVDLRFLDPNMPITVDLNVVKGRARTIPVQPDPETFKNVSYNEGFADLLKFDPVSAVRHFEQAQKERPNDPVVRDALLLAQDLVNVHQQKEQDVKARTAHWTMQTYVTLMSGETGGALAFITRARDLNPNDKGIRVLAALTEKVARESNLANTPEKRAAYRLVGNGIVSVAKGDHAMAVNYLEVARRLSPNDPYIANLLRQARNLETGHADAKKH
jgi:tetratricopeptide (TPR) repeat protein